MKKAFFQKHNIFEGYHIPEGMLTRNFELYHINGAIDPIEDTLVNCEIVNRENKVYIYSDESFKKQEYKEFATLEEGVAREEDYERYYDKRWEEIPKVEMSIEDWEELKKKWKKIKEESPKYIMFILDDSGPLDKVKIIGKDELSQEDLGYIKVEHEKYLKYEKARQKYIQNHPDYSEVWRGPQDDEYEADIMKYYED